MKGTLIVLAALCCPDGMVTGSEIQFNNRIPYPTVHEDRLPLRMRHNIAGQAFYESVPEVNFEISSRLHVHEGRVPSHSIYNLSSYSNSADRMHCQIYPTDFQRGHEQSLALNERVVQTLVVEQSTPEIARAYVQVASGQILEVEMLHQAVRLQDSAPETITISHRISEGLPTSDSKTSLLSLNSTLYIATQTDLKYYHLATKKVLPVSGYERHSDFVQAKSMAKSSTDSIEFYVLSLTGLKIYRLGGPALVTLVQEVDDIGLGGRRPAHSIFSHPFFYLTGGDRLSVLDLTVRSKVRVSHLKMNGSCTEIGKFKSALHVSCTQGRESYIAEFKALGSSLVLNRFYSDLELPAAFRAKRIAQSTMALIGDEEVRVLNYAVNRNLLLELDHRQPNTNFPFRDGQDVFPIDSFKKPQSFTLLKIYQRSISLEQINRTPSQLYCEFEQDRPGSEYSLLLELNSTLCTFSEDDQVFQGSLEQTCTVWLPLQITSEVQILDRSKAGLISGGIILLVAAALGLMLFFGIRHIYEHNRKFRNAIDRLRKAQDQGYSQKPKII